MINETLDRELFERIAADYCRKDLHPAARIARRHRLLRTLACVDLRPDAEVLEAGCGAGFSAAYLAGRYGRFQGIDYSENLIEYARHQNGSATATFEAVNIKDFSPGRSYDAVFLIGVLHHLDDMPAALGRLVGALRPGGWLIANEPHPGNPVVRLARAVRKRVDAKYSDDQQQLDARQLHEALAGAGLMGIRIRPQGIFSTPFAEVPMGPTFLTRPMAAVACAVDTLLESVLGGALGAVTWNLIAAGRKPL